MNLKLENKSVVVIGGSRGIGLSIVEGFLDEKARVSIIARNISDKLKSQLIKEGNQVNFYEGDATDKKSLISIKNSSSDKFIIRCLISFKFADSLANNVSSSSPL